MNGGEEEVPKFMRKIKPLQFAKTEKKLISSTIRHSSVESFYQELQGLKCPYNAQMKN